MGARMAAASQPGLPDDRERGEAGRMGGDGISARAEVTSRARRVSNARELRTSLRGREEASGPAPRLDTARGPLDDRSEMGVLHGLVAALLGAGLGVQAFLSFLVAPATFRAVDRPVAARVMEGVFPGYYGFGLATMAMALALVVALAFREPSPLRWGTAALLALAVAGTLYAGRVVLPAAHAARLRAQAAPAGDLAPLEFSRLHRWAVAVNISVFATGAVALALHLATGASGRPGVGPRARVASERTHDNAPSGLGL
jgi:hypothetical protein